MTSILLKRSLAIPNFFKELELRTKLECSSTNPNGSSKRCDALLLKIVVENVTLRHSSPNLVLILLPSSCLRL